jgi:hypothetical protein
MSAPAGGAPPPAGGALPLLPGALPRIRGDIGDLIPDVDEVQIVPLSHFDGLFPGDPIYTRTILSWRPSHWYYRPKDVVYQKNCRGFLLQMKIGGSHEVFSRAILMGESALRSGNVKYEGRRL